MKRMENKAEAKNDCKRSDSKSESPVAKKPKVTVKSNAEKNHLQIALLMQDRVITPPRLSPMAQWTASQKLEGKQKEFDPEKVELRKRVRERMLLVFSSLIPDVSQKERTSRTHIEDRQTCRKGRSRRTFMNRQKDAGGGESNEQFFHEKKIITEF